MELIINGEKKTLDIPKKNISIEELLAHLSAKIDFDSIAIAVNENVIKKDVWNKPVIKSGDVIEIIHAVQGG